MKNDIWIVAEQHQGKVAGISFELLTRGLALAAKSGQKLCAMLFGHNIEESGLQELIDRGADMVAVIDAPELKNFLVEPYSQCMLEILRKYEPQIVLAGATSSGRTVLPYVAMTAHTGLTADCTELDIEPESGLLLQTRPAIGGNIMATIKCPDFRPQMATIRPRSTPQAPRLAGRAGTIERLPLPEKAKFSRVRFDRFIPEEEEFNLQDAERIVVVGRGIKKAENLPLIRELADALGAAVGATREVIDRGWLSYPHQIGLSGKTVTPKFYFAVGVSGAIQHLAGMQTSETIVAVNSDPEAQIFQVADFGIVGNLFEVLPPLIEKIKRGEKAW
ncbi:electron transfer flavoprotein subunit alpha/FixB family protein [Lentisphaerota bacterium ZTH]|nr:electron transfer flavoprotein subunit alpha/FixB family protein [Lentisphaerota bacterium]WET05935.1 electron transfer flavoprotein subunit alpha/FixB family protein [Lentisphaerota bacterium ZTH]